MVDNNRLVNRSCDYNGFILKLLNLKKANK